VNLVQRKLLMGGLVAAFAAQTTLVYLDDTASTFETLTEEAVRGRRLWHKHNCQSCHQIHGFGGFLGPDLTNAGQRLTDERLEEVLTVGVAQMPAFHLNEDERGDLAIFLDELSVMGVGVPRRYKPLDPASVRSAMDQRLVELSSGDTPVPESVVRGAAAFKMNCSACHVPLQATPLGLQTAPDLTTALTRIDAKAVHATIADGRPERGMQAWSHLGEQTVDDLAAFVLWLNEDRDALIEEVGGVGIEQPLPWWEYK
jgi:nitric oxide reductase subunit C